MNFNHETTTQEEDDKEALIAEFKRKLADYESCVVEQRKLAETLRERESEIADLKRQG